MSQENRGLVLSFKTATDLSAKRYMGVKLSAAQTVAAVAGATDDIIGFLQNAPVSGQHASVAVGGSGTCKAMAGAAITAGAYCKLDANGKLVTGGGGGDENWAIALESSLADGDVIEVLPLMPKLVS